MIKKEHIQLIIFFKYVDFKFFLFRLKYLFKKEKIFYLDLFIKKNFSFKNLKKNTKSINNMIKSFEINFTRINNYDDLIDILHNENSKDFLNLYNLFFNIIDDFDFFNRWQKAAISSYLAYKIYQLKSKYNFKINFYILKKSKKIIFKKLKI